MVPDIIEEISIDGIASALSETWIRMQEYEALSLHNQSLALTREYFSSGMASVLRIIDNTNSGGLHFVAALLDPNLDVIPFMLSPETESEMGILPYRQAAHLPTACHLIEVASAICTYCGSVPQPPVFLTERDFIQALVTRALAHAPSLVGVINVPLMFNPPMTNAIIFHTQSPTFSPLAFLDEWYRTLVHNMLIDKLVLRHTLLLRPLADRKDQLDRPRTKHVAHFRVLPTPEVQDRFRLLHLGRVSSWDYSAAQEPSKRISIADLTSDSS
jgi:hypothetical protein